MANSEIVLGIDPGFGRLGYGVIKKDNRGAWRALDYGCVETKPKSPLPERLVIIRDELVKVIKKYQPTLAGIEQLFFFNNAKTAMDVGQARGVVILTMIDHKIPFVEFTPLQVKQGITGYGKAEKGQMQKMVAMLLGIKGKIKSDDAADALAIAMCAGDSIGFMRKINKIKP
ncbi:MAG: crossover junction endodeoxyribonuclease RuvC [bacterium]|nr:crossover junction endodeoxyribonuclease RuvC [bacterium]